MSKVVKQLSGHLRHFLVCLTGLPFGVLKIGSMAGTLGAKEAFFCYNENATSLS